MGHTTDGAGLGRQHFFQETVRVPFVLSHGAGEERTVRWVAKWLSHSGGSLDPVLSARFSLSAQLLLPIPSPPVAQLDGCRADGMG